MRRSEQSKLLISILLTVIIISGITEAIAGSPATISINANPENVIIENTSLITASVYDANGNLIDPGNDTNVTFTTTLGNFTENSSATYTVKTINGTATANLSATTGGNAFVQVNVTDNTSITAATSVCFCDGSVAGVDFEVLNSSMVATDEFAANGLDKPTIIAWVVDACGSRVAQSDIRLNLTWTNATGATVGPVSNTTNESGYVRFDDMGASDAIYNSTITINSTYGSVSKIIHFYPSEIELTLTANPPIIATQDINTTAHNSTITLSLSYTAYENESKQYHALPDVLINFTTDLGTLSNATVSNVTSLINTTDSLGKASVVLTSGAVDGNATVTARIVNGSLRTYHNLIPNDAISIVILTENQFLRTTTTITPTSVPYTPYEWINVTHEMEAVGPVERPVDIMHVIDVSGSMTPDVVSDRGYTPYNGSYFTGSVNRADSRYWISPTFTRSTFSDLFDDTPTYTTHRGIGVEWPRESGTDLDIYLYENGALVAYSTSGSYNPEILSYELKDGKTYYLKVDGYDTNGHSIDFEINSYIDKMSAAKQAALLFNNYTENNTRMRLGLVKFPISTGDRNLAELVNSLTSDIESVNSNIESLSAIGGTPTGHAVLTAKNELTDSSRSRYIVLLSDGQPTYGYNSAKDYPTPGYDEGPFGPGSYMPSDVEENTYAWADDAKNASVTIYTIGFGVDVGPGTEGERVLTNVASDAPPGSGRTKNYFYAPNSTRLSEIYREIIQEINSLNSQINVRINISGVNVSGTFSPNAVYRNNSTRIYYTTANGTVYNLTREPEIVWGSYKIEFNNLSMPGRTTFEVGDRLNISYQLRLIRTGNLFEADSNVSNADGSLSSIPGGAVTLTTYSDSDRVNTPPDAVLDVVESKWQTSDPTVFVVNPGETITFDASRSWDSYNGYDLNYTWIIEKAKNATTGAVSEWLNMTNVSNATVPTIYNTTEVGKFFNVTLVVWDKDDELPQLSDTAYATVYITNPSNLNLTSDQSEILANGGISNLTATLTNATGSPIQGVTISFTQPYGTFGSFNSSTDDADASGKAGVKFTAGHITGVATVMAETPGSPTAQPWFYGASDGRYYIYSNATATIRILPSGQITLS